VIVTVNGERHELASPTTVARLIESLGVAPGARGVAVALNGEVVARGRWPETELPDGAQIEVVAAIQGG
jgi:sulfur carrier protein